jgi:tetratricopeptide (TPR) repeat protein
MSSNYKLKLSGGRVVGPLTLDQVVELYVIGRIEGDDQCQQFPGGDWQRFDAFPEITAKIADQIATDSGQSAAGSRSSNNTASKTQTVPEIPTHDLTKTKAKPKSPPAAGDAPQEFTYRNKIGTMNEEDYLPDENAESMVEATQLIDRTMLTSGSPTAEDGEDFDKTIVSSNPFPELIKESELEEKDVSSEQSKGEGEDFSDVDSSKNQVAVVEIDHDEKTQMVDLGNAIATLKQEAELSEKEFQETIEAQKREEAGETLDEEDETEEDEEEDNSWRGKLERNKKRVVMVVGVVLLLAFMLSGEDSQKNKIKPIFPKIAFPITDEESDPESALNLYNEGLDLYRRGDYIGKLKAAARFRVSVERNIKDNPALGMLILSYAEVLRNTSKPEKDPETIFRLLQIANQRVLTDINVALGASIFFSYMDKSSTAINTIENYLRLSKPSVKLYAYYLEHLVSDGQYARARKVFDKLLKLKSPSAEVDLAIVNYLISDQQFKGVEQRLRGAIKRHPRRVMLYLKYAANLVEMENYKPLPKVLDTIKKLKAERSPLYYAKYLELRAMLSIMKGDSEKGTLYFQKALKFHDSKELRSTLASLELGGGDNTKMLIKESKIIHNIKKAKIAIKERRWDDAFRHAIEASDIAPGHIPAQLLLAHVQVERGYFHAAIETLEELNKRYGSDPEVSFALVDAYVHAMKLESANRKIAMISATKMIGLAGYASMLGRFYLKKKSPLLAIKWLQTSLNRNPLNDRDYFLLAKLFVKHRKYKKAKIILSKAINLEPNNVYYRSLYGKMLYELEGSDIAIGYLRNALKSFPDNAKIIGDIAVYYYRDGKSRAFERYLKMAQDLPNQDVHFYQFLIDASILENKTDDVINYSRHLIRLKPGDIAARMNLGAYLFENNRISDALNEFKAVDERFSTYPKLHYYLALILIKQHKYKQAMVHGQKEVENHPTKEHGHYVVGEIYRLMQDYLKAVPKLEKALSINGKFKQSLLSLAWVKFRQNYLETARELYLRALKRDPGDGNIHKQLGNIYRLIGQGGLALESYNTYLQLVPNAPDEKKIRQLIKHLQ